MYAPQNQAFGHSCQLSSELSGTKAHSIVWSVPAFNQHCSIVSNAGCDMLNCVEPCNSWLTKRVALFDMLCKVSLEIVIGQALRLRGKLCRM